jgi:alanine dehydrogenase
LALSNATISYVRKLANEGVVNAIKNDISLAMGVNVCRGTVTNLSVAKTHNLEFKSVESCLEE